MRVLVTRPEPSASRTMRRLIALGHQAEVLPLFAALHLTDEAEKALSGNPGSLIVTSAEAARALASLPEHLAAHVTKPLFAVGAATARAFAQLGFEDIRTAEGNGQILAERIIREWRKTAPLLYLAGEPRSPHLEDALREAGFQFSTVTLYRMLPVDYTDAAIADRLSRYPDPTILLYSGEAARRFAELAGRSGTTAPTFRLCCLSESIRQCLPMSLQARARAAREPNEDSLLALLDEDQA